MLSNTNFGLKLIVSQELPVWDCSSEIDFKKPCVLCLKPDFSNINVFPKIYLENIPRIPWITMKTKKLLKKSITSFYCDINDRSWICYFGHIMSNPREVYNVEKNRRKQKKTTSRKVNWLVHSGNRCTIGRTTGTLRDNTNLTAHNRSVALVYKYTVLFFLQMFENTVSYHNSFQMERRKQRFWFNSVSLRRGLGYCIGFGIVIICFQQLFNYIKKILSEHKHHTF